jgi:hypothetical protein
MLLIDSFKILFIRLRELIYHVRDIHTTVLYLDREYLKDNFNNNLIVIDDPISAFILKNKIYIQNKNAQDTHRRLFITTGGISLITAISIKKSIMNSKCEDYLLIDTITKHSITFLENNTNIASLYDFKKIIFMQNQINYHILIDYGLENIDEIFMVAHLKLYQFIKLLYPSIPITFLEEGPGTLSYPIYDYSKINKVIVHNYLNKYDFVVWHTTKVKPIIEFVDEKIFQETLGEIREKLNIKMKLNPEEKFILICGPDIESKKYIKKTKINTHIIKLINRGYKILFKKHPRDTEPYIFDDAVTIIDTSYPIELYDLNIVAAVNYSSSICITLPYFKKLAVFSDMTHLKISKIDIPYMLKLTQFIIKQYTIPIEYLIKFDHKKYSSSQLRIELFNLTLEYIAKMPDVSNNNNINKLISKNIKYLNRVSFKILWNSTSI